MKKEEMPIITKREIEERVSRVGEYLKIDILSNYLKMNIDFSARKFVLKSLAELYEKKGILKEAAKLMNNCAEIDVSFESKIDDYMKAFELFIKSEEYHLSEITFNKALSCANTQKKEELKTKRREIYKNQAESLIKKDKRKSAVQIYERMLELDYTQEEKKEIKKILMGLYEKLGKIREFYEMKKVLENSI